MKARILNSEFQGIYTNDFISKNLDKVINGQLVSEWQLTDVLPSENLLKPQWNGTEWTESATPEELEAFENAQIPTRAKNWQIREALIELYGVGIIATIDTAIENLPDPPKTIVCQMWNFREDMSRTNEYVNMLGQALNIDIKETWKLANQIQ